MAYVTVVAGTTITAAWANESVRDQGVSQFASSAARSSAITSPVEGMVNHLNDTNVLGVYTGAAWSTVGPVHGALTSWTPTVTQSGSVTVTVNYAKYQRVGRMIMGWFKVTCTGSGTISNPVIIGGIPATAAASDVGIGPATLYDTSTTQNWLGLLTLESTTTFSIASGDGSTGGDARFGMDQFTNALASGDIIKGAFTYEASADA